MGDLVNVAERLRAVKRAQRRFLRMWDIERAVIDPLIDRLAAAMECGRARAGPRARSPGGRAGRRIPVGPNPLGGRPGFGRVRGSPVRPGLGRPGFGLVLWVESLPASG